MRRRLSGLWRTVAMFALVGGALNVVVTWSMATTFLPHRMRARFAPSPRMRAETAETWPHVRAGGVTPTVYLRSTSRTSTDDFGYWGYPQSKGVEHSMAVFAFGWPMRSLGCWYEGDLAGGGVQWTQRWHGAWRFNTDVAAATLPLAPLPGFIVNTAVYGGVLWSVMAGARGLARWARGRRGGCVKCGYDVTGIVGGRCPECGAALESVRGPETAASSVSAGAGR